MGTYRNAYVGIYLEVPYQKAEVIDVKYKHPVTGHKMSSKFDKDTGVKAIKVENKRNVYIEPSPYIVDVEGFIEDMFTKPAYTGGGKNIATFVLNSDSERFSSFDDGLFNFSFMESPDSIIEDFKVEYANYLEYYKNLYGEFDIRYGVVVFEH